MIKKPASFITYFSKQPRLLFLTDGIGALITSLLLFTVLTPFNEYFGMPKHLLYRLALIAIGFSLYSFTCYALKTKNLKLFLLIIAVANIIYCLLTIGLVLYNLSHMTILGIAYFMGECIIIGILVFVEIKIGLSGKK